MSDLIERAKKCAEFWVGTIGRDMIEELIGEIGRLNGELVATKEAYENGNKDRLRLYEWKKEHENAAEKAVKKLSDAIEGVGDIERAGKW